MSTTTSLFERYDAVLLFSALAVLAPAATLWKRLARPVAAAVALVLVAMVGWNRGVRLDIVNAVNGESLKIHERIAEIASRDSKNWTRDSQVVFILQAPLDSATRGFNHWST